MPGVITERLAVLIDAQAGGAIREFDKLSGKATKAGVDTGGLSKAFQSMGISAETAGGIATASTAAVVVGVGLLAAAADASLDAVTGLAGQVRGLQRVTGASAEDASRLAAELTRFGIASDVAEKGLFKFDRTIADTPEKLTQLGVQLARNADGTVNVAATLKNLGDAYRATGDATQRAELAQAAFGRAGIQLLPLLSATREQLAAVDELAQTRGAILSQDDVENAKKYTVALGQMKAEAEGVKVTFGKALLPRAAEEFQNLAVGVDRLRRLANGEGWNESLKNASTAIESATAFQQQTDAAQAAAQESRELDNAQRALVQSSLAVASTSRAIEQAQIGEAAAERTLNEARREQANFERNERQEQRDDLNAIQSATFGVADAFDRERDAERAVDDLTRRFADGTAGAALAQRDLRSAILDSADAQDRLAAAQKTVDELANPTAKTREEAARRVESAQLDLADAQQRVIDATTALNHAHTTKDRANASRDLERANLGLATATAGLADAQENEQRTLGLGEQAAHDRAEADRNLERAKIDAEAATGNQAEAQHAADVSATTDADSLETAVRRVERARLDVVKAVGDEGKARQKLEDDNATRADQRAATDEKVRSSTLNVKAAQDGVAGAVLAAQKAQDDFYDKAGDAKVAQAAADNLKPLIAKYGELADVIDRVNTAAGVTPTAAPPPPPDVGTGLDDDYATGANTKAPLVAGQPAGPYDNHGAVMGRASGAAPPPQVIELHVDGRKMAEVVTGHQEQSVRNGGARTIR